MKKIVLNEKAQKLQREAMLRVVENFRPKPFSRWRYGTDPHAIDYADPSRTDFAIIHSFGRTSIVIRTYGAPGRKEWDGKSADSMRGPGLGKATVNWVDVSTLPKINRFRD